jgi:DNA-directed RNA polymerase subunit RPC12/RpoP
VDYFAECAVVKDFDPRQKSHNLRMQALEATLQRIPAPGGAWRAAGGFWPYAELFKEQMELTYEMIFKKGINLPDPDNAPMDVALHMEYSTFCQAWLPHLSPEDGAKLLALYGLDAQYDEVKPLDTDQHSCGHCGAQLTTLPGAQKVICESCGFAIEVGGAAIPCRKCGSLLSFPEGVIQLACPYCQTDTRRV